MCSLCGNVLQPYSNLRPGQLGQNSAFIHPSLKHWKWQTQWWTVNKHRATRNYRDSSATQVSFPRQHAHASESISLCLSLSSSLPLFLSLSLSLSVAVPPLQRFHAVSLEIARWFHRTTRGSNDEIADHGLRRNPDLAVPKCYSTVSGAELSQNHSYDDVL